MSPIVGASASPLMIEVAGEPIDERRRDREERADHLKNQRPTIDWRICSSAERCARLRKRSTAPSCWPNVLVSSMPLTLTVSSVIAVMSARRACV